MITVDDYFMGRREQYPLALSPTIERNAQRTVNIVNALLARAMGAGIHADTNPKTGSPVSSGWRPPVVNIATPGASPTSGHMTGESVDLYDPAGKLDAWLMTADGQAAMVELGLWLEHPDKTPNWCHLQTKPPRSGNRVFWP